MVVTPLMDISSGLYQVRWLNERNLLCTKYLTAMTRKANIREHKA